MTSLTINLLKVNRPPVEKRSLTICEVECFPESAQDILLAGVETDEDWEALTEMEWKKRMKRAQAEEWARFHATRGDGANTFFFNNFVPATDPEAMEDANARKAKKRWGTEHEVVASMWMVGKCLSRISFTSMGGAPDQFIYRLSLRFPTLRFSWGYEEHDSSVLAGSLVLLAGRDVAGEFCIEKKVVQTGGREVAAPGSRYEAFCRSFGFTPVENKRKRVEIY